MNPNIFDTEEERVNSIAFIFGVLASVGAFIVVRGFLEGLPRDNIVLIIPVICIVIRILEKNVSCFKKYVKWMYMTIPFWGTVVIVVSNDGKYAAVTQAYFMWLMLSVAYYNAWVVLCCSAVTIVSTAGAILLFPEAMYKLDNLTIWLYILSVYLLATLLAAIIANRMRNLIIQTRQLKAYEDELIYMEQLEKKEEKHSEFIHNVNHYFRAIGELAKEDHCEQIVNLITELDAGLMQNERIIYTNHRVANAVLSVKAGEASENDIDFDVYVETGIQFGNTSDSDLAAMLGNLLDNAIEAAKQCTKDKRKIVLRIFMEQKGKICVVKAVNYFVKKPLRHKSGFISSKTGGGMHGIGIKSVEHMAEKYNGYLQCLIDGDCFSSILVLPLTIDKNRP